MALVPLNKVLDDDLEAMKKTPQADVQSDEASPAEGTAPEQAAPNEEAEPQQQTAGSPAEGGPPTEQEQAAYTKFVQAAGVLMYQDDASHANIMKHLELQKDNPAPAIAEATNSIVVEVDKQSGNSTPERVIIPAAIEIAGHIAELGQSAGFFQADDQLMGKVGQAVLVKIGDSYGVTPQEMQAFLAQFSPDEKEAARAQQEQYANGGQQQGGLVPAEEGAPA